MGEIILLILWVVWVVKSGTTALWWTGGIVLLIIIGCAFSRKNKHAHASRERPRTRIDHPHYITNDESECSTCGARFPKRLSSCPRCGVTFDSVKKDEEEWFEEFDEECAWDEEEGW